MRHWGQSSGRRAPSPPAPNQPRPGSSAGGTPGFGKFFASAHRRRRLVAIFLILRGGGGKMIGFSRFWLVGRPVYRPVGRDDRHVAPLASVSWSVSWSGGAINTRRDYDPLPLVHRFWAHFPSSNWCWMCRRHMAANVFPPVCDGEGVWLRRGGGGDYRSHASAS
jgi:hypothetical protein